MQTTHTIDYTIEKVEAKDKNQTSVTLKREGMMPMPLDIIVIGKDKKPYYFYIPLTMLFGKKQNPYPNMPTKELPFWGWAYPTYTFTIDMPSSEIESVIIDPQGLMADSNRDNNLYLNDK